MILRGELDGAPLETSRTRSRAALCRALGCGLALRWALDVENGNVAVDMQHDAHCAHCGAQSSDSARIALNGDDEDDVIPCCFGSVAKERPTLPLPALDDEEDARLPRELPDDVVDAHVHVFPDAIFRAVWRWFDQFGWPIRYKLYADDVVRYLTSRGVADVVLLHYAHKPGIARSMNAFVAELAKRHDVTGVATVFPGEDGQIEILEEAFALGLKGIKLHCHVQAMPADDARLFPVYELCAKRGLPVVIHAGREPKSEALPVDPYVICDVSRVERILRQFPSLKLSIPHLGADEFEGYAQLLQRYENVWLDTTMMLSGYIDAGDLMPYVRRRPDRVLFGTDFPNLPYAWDREAKAIARAGFSDVDVERLMAGNARELFGLV